MMRATKKDRMSERGKDNWQEREERDRVSEKEKESERERDARILIGNCLFK